MARLSSEVKPLRPSIGPHPWAHTQSYTPSEVSTSKLLTQRLWVHAQTVILGCLLYWVLEQHEETAHLKG